MSQLKEAKRKLPIIINNESSSKINDFENRVELIDKFEIIDLKNIKSSEEVSSIAALDSSSKYLRDPSANMVIVGLSIYSSKVGFIDGPYSLKIPFFAISSKREILETLNTPDFVRTRNVINEYFEADILGQEGYRIDDVADEMRTEVENIALSSLHDHDLIILDGPIYPTPLELGIISLKGARKIHRLAYAKLVKERIEIARGRNIVGIVKRLENSEKLRKDEKIREIFEKKINFNISNKKLSDLEVLELLNSHLIKRKGIFALGPFRLIHSLRVEEVSLKDVPDKYSYYIIINYPPFPTTYLRFESLDLTILNKSLSKVIFRLSDKLLPTYIDLVDNRCKRVTSSLFITAFQIASEFLSIIHDDKMSYYNTIREYEL
jgi:hypothetical protein